MGSPVVVLGHSFGGRVALHLAVQHPEVVSALVLTGAPMLHPRSRTQRVALAYRVTRRLHAVRLVSDEAMEAARQRFGSADYRAAQGVMRQVLVRAVNERYGDELAALRCPYSAIATGRSISTTNPGPALRARIVPLCNSTARRAIDSPRPAPPLARSRSVSTR